MALATAAGATVTQTVTSVTPNAIGQGAVNVPVTIAGTGFAADGGTVTVTSTTAHVTFSSIKEVSSTEITADVSVTNAVAANATPSVTVTDDNSPIGGTTLANAFTVDAAPTVTGVSPSLLALGTGASTLTISGTGFETGATVSFYSQTNDTTLTSASVTVVNSTEITVSVTPTNSVTGAAATTGAYNLKLVNADGGQPSAGETGVLSVEPVITTNASPSAVAESASAQTVPVTIAGGGFEPGATVVLSGGGGDCGVGQEVSVDTNVGTVVNAAGTTITATFSIEASTTGVSCSIAVDNPENGGNGDDSAAVAGEFAVGEASSIAPTITGSNSTTAIVAGAGAASVTLTGTGFGYGQTTLDATDSNSNSTDGTGLGDNDLTPTYVSFGATGTSYTFDVAASSGVVAGTDAISVEGSNAFPTAFSIAGPAITSQTPAAIVVGAPYGTVITLTGTGFTNTTIGGLADAAGGTLTGLVYYASATTEDLVVENSPTADDVTTATSADSAYVDQVNAYGDTVYSADFPLTIDNGPTVNGAVTYKAAGAVALTDVGVGASAQTVYFTGTGFQTGVKVGSFVNGNGVADADVTATVTAVTSTKITATIAIAAGDKNAADGYTVTNPDGGTVSVSVSSGDGLVIGAAPTISAVSPSTSNAGTTNALTITGTGFESGALVTASPSTNGFCGVATVVSSSSITVTCDFGATNATATTLVVTNLDGGNATSATVLPAYVAPVVVNYHITGESGNAVAGKTVHISISGAGFYGQPAITSTAAGTHAIVSGDTGTTLTVVITSSAKVTGEHTLTVTLADGKVAKVNYKIVK